MRQSILVSGSTPEEFVDNYNETVTELSRFEILREKDLSDTSVLIFYEIPDEVNEKVEATEAGEPVDYTIDLADPDAAETTEIFIKIVAPVPVRRYCCECDHYDWGKGCPFADRHLRHMDGACKMFHVNIGRRF